MKLDKTHLIEKIPLIVESPVNKQLANDMMQFMRRRKGIGLAANQVGIPYRLFVMHVTDKSPRRCFNPRILEKSHNIFSMEEGCLSYPNIFIDKNRSRNIIVEYTNQDGRLIEAELFDLEAVCFQHELDHLDGIEWNTSSPKITNLL